jgi:hypothetical protein
MAKPTKIPEDTIEHLLDKIGILREELVSIERSLERMKAAPTAKEIRVNQERESSLNSLASRSSRRSFRHAR